ncbi:MAG: 4Fe-4S dicluster domain-containing protein [Xanthobacteraceae bacterium]
MLRQPIPSRQAFHAMSGGERAIVTLEGLQSLLVVLERRGYRVVGPTRRGEAIVYDDISDLSDLPQGWSDEQDGGHYRLHKREDEALFGYAVGPHSWKQFLHLSMLSLWRVEKRDQGFEIASERDSPQRLALLGVRSCEICAIAIQDRVFLAGPYVDSHYRARRDGAFIVAVNCGHAAGTCFCVSMETGPKAESGFDLSLTEMITAGRHVFLLEVGTEAGAEMLGEVPHEAADDDDVAGAEAVVARTAASMGRAIDTDNIKDLLLGNLQHRRWDNVAERCLTCGNCTMVCPTCFCTAVEDACDVSGQVATRSRRWDSCFTMDFSYIHGGSVRSSAKSRYRQWMTHKLASWFDQFGTSGCVGCGRCITWCPVGIDITEEVRAIRSSAAR